jgi:hypothetical protein
MNLFTKASSLLQYCDDIHLLHFYKINNNSLKKLPSKTASLLLRAIPIFFLSSRGQHSTCKRDTAVQMLLHPQIDHHWALQYTWERYHAHKLPFTCGIYEFSICFLDLKFYDILLYSILRHLTLLNFTCHHFTFHLLFSFWVLRHLQLFIPTITVYWYTFHVKHISFKAINFKTPKGTK